MSLRNGWMMAALCACLSALAVASAANAAPEEPPEYGRCLKVPTGGVWSTGACTTTTGTTHSFGWFAAFGSTKPMVKTHFTTKTKEGAGVAILPHSGSVITCKEESSGGEFTGNKTTAGITMKLTGCQLTGTGSCSSSGAAEGEIVTAALTGTLGVIKKSTEGPVKNLIGTLLKPAPGEPIAAFACAGTPVTITGGVIAEITRNAMSTRQTLKFVQAKGGQSPQRFEGGPEESPKIKVGEEQPQVSAGIAFGTFQTDEEKVEVNSTV